MHTDVFRGMRRKQFLALCLTTALVSTCPVFAADSTAAPISGAQRIFARLEHGAGGTALPAHDERLGIYALDTGTGRVVAYRAAERFPMCSTWKLLVAALLLQRVDQQRELLDRRVLITANDIVPNSTILHDRTGPRSMTLWELAAIMIEHSDNTASNIILREVGGPAVLTAFVRSIGDGITRLDRNEPSLNSSLPHDPRDTTSPKAMVETMRSLLLGSVLSYSSRTQLESWLAGNVTGNARIRAGSPASADIGDKTGTGDNGSTNDVAVIRLAGGAPILLAVYYTGSGATPHDRDAVIATATRATLAML